MDVTLTPSMLGMPDVSLLSLICGVGLLVIGCVLSIFGMRVLFSGGPVALVLVIFAVVVIVECFAFSLIGFGDFLGFFRFVVYGGYGGGKGGVGRSYYI